MPDFSAFSGIGRYGAQAPVENNFSGNIPIVTPPSGDMAGQFRQNRLLREGDQQKRDVRNALQLAGTDPEGAQTALIQAGALDQAGELGKIQGQKRAQAALVAAQAKLPTDRRGAMDDLTLGGHGDVAKQLGDLDTAQLAQAKEKTQILGALYGAFAQVPAEQRAAQFAQYAPQMVKMGLITAEQAAHPQLDDQTLQTGAAMAITAEQQVTNALQAKTQAETARHNQVGETNDQGVLAETGRHNKTEEGISGQNAQSQRISAGAAASNASTNAAELGLKRQEFGAKQASGQFGKQPTEDQAKTGFNAQRMAGASQTINQLEAAGGFNPTMSQAGSAMMGGNSRAYEAAKSEWKDAIIRMTTGAAATKQEMEAADRAYFPQFGDPPAVVKQKAARRAAVQQDAETRAAGQRQQFAPSVVAPPQNRPTLDQIFGR